MISSNARSALAGALAERNWPHELILLPKGGHGLGGGDPKLIDAAYGAFEFVKAHLK